MNERDYDYLCKISLQARKMAQRAQGCAKVAIIIALGALLLAGGVILRQF